jgi:hypothetical protein
LALGKPASYCYITGGKDGRGSTVWFCWSCHRNENGYFLGWREIRARKGIKRDSWIARRVRRRCKELAERRAAAFQQKQAE